MNIPAYACRPLCIGRTYDARNSSAGIDIFPSGFPTKTINKYRLIFKYKKVQNSKDVKDLLDISGQISLKIKAGILKAEGSGEYLSDSNRKEGTTEILAVLKYITVTESMDGIVDVVEKVARGEIKHGLGTHYVRSVSYGAEMTASLSIETSSDSNTYDIQGSVDGDIGVIKAKVVDLKSQLQSVATQSSDQTNIAIKCYTTGIKHDKSPTSLDDLVNLIEQFMSSLERIDEGRGVPLEFELMPIETAMQTSESLVKYSLFTITDDLEQCFDDLRDAQGLVDKYENTQKDNDEDDDDDVVHFCEQITEVMGQFKEAISLINSFEGKDRVDACLKAYRDALDGRNIPRKFCKKWKRILKTKKPEAAAEASSTVQKPEAAAEASSTVQFPEGKDLTVVLLGKAGNGKSATGNTILGSDILKESDSPKPESTKCELESSTYERQIHVIDTPGYMEEWLSDERPQDHIVREMVKVFGMAPDGYDAICLVVKYGCRFTREDARAFNFLHTFFGKNAEKKMLLILSYADEAKRMAEKEKISVAAKVRQWREKLPSWVQEFIQRIGENRVLLFDNTLEKNTDASKEQVLRFVQIIDEDPDGPLVLEANELSKLELERIMEAEAAWLDNIKKDLENEKKSIACRLNQDDLTDTDKQELEQRLHEIEPLLEEMEKSKVGLRKSSFRKLIELVQDDNSKIVLAIGALVIALFAIVRPGGCFPESATFVDKHGLRRKMSSMHIGEEVKVIMNNKISSEPVITFIHRQPEVMQKFLQITTLQEKILNITEDHLLFVEKEGEADAIPARDVNIGDTVYVRGDQGEVQKDEVQSIRPVFEKGVYAPVTLSGTVLVNDVHTSCYFDVLSHEWSHRAMGAARAVYHVSPWMLQWISGVGEKDGFPGWCRLAHKMLTFMD